MGYGHVTRTRLRVETVNNPRLAKHFGVQARARYFLGNERQVGIDVD
jgi:hypothetical protein